MSVDDDLTIPLCSRWQFRREEIVMISMMNDNLILWCGQGSRLPDINPKMAIKTMEGILICIDLPLLITTEKDTSPIL